MESVENIFPTLQKRLFHASERPFIASLRYNADSICRGSISERYIHKAFNDFKNGYAYYYPDSNEPIGFCIWKIKNSETITKNNKTPYSYMYLYLICAKQTDFKLARVMFHDIEVFCQEKGIQYIQLQPANKKLMEHYESFGFSVTDTLNTIMTKSVIPIKIQKSKTRKAHKTKTLANLPEQNHIFDM